MRDQKSEPIARLESHAAAKNQNGFVFGQIEAHYFKLKRIAAETHAGM
jgi:hypothetical protein